MVETKDFFRPMRCSTNDERISSDEVPFPVAFRPHPHALSMIYTPDVPSKLVCIFNEPAGCTALAARLCSFAVFYRSHVGRCVL